MGLIGTQNDTKLPTTCDCSLHSHFSVAKPWVDLVFFFDKTTTLRCSFAVIRCRDTLECPGNALGDCAEGREGSHWNRFSSLGLHSSSPVTCERASLQMVTWKKSSGIACNNCALGYYPVDDGACFLAAKVNGMPPVLDQLLVFFPVDICLNHPWQGIPCKGSFRQEVWLSQESSFCLQGVSFSRWLLFADWKLRLQVCNAALEIRCQLSSLEFLQWSLLGLQCLGMVMGSLTERLRLDHIHSWLLDPQLPRWLLVYCLRSMLIWTSILDVESRQDTWHLNSLPFFSPVRSGNGFRKHRCVAQQIGSKQSVCAWSGQRILDVPCFQAEFELADRCCSWKSDGHGCAGPNSESGSGTGSGTKGWRTLISFNHNGSNFLQSLPIKSFNCHTCFF